MTDHDIINALCCAVARLIHDDPETYDRIQLGAGGYVIEVDYTTGQVYIDGQPVGEPDTGCCMVNALLYESDDSEGAAR